MKRTVFSIVAAAFATVAAAQTGAAPAPGPARMAVIDVERLIRESAMGREAFGRVKKLNDQKKDEADKLAKELRDMEQKLADQGQSMTDDKRDALQKQYQEKAIAYKRFNDDAQRVLEEAQKKELEGLEKRVLPVIQTVGKEKGYTLIFNKFQSGIVFADEAVDVTDDVLKRFNTTVAVPEKADAAPRPAAPPAAPKAATTKKPAGN
ncbi:MAG: OmpH family outer membrane protein [Thermoanaerobaculia bacterium]